MKRFLKVFISVLAGLVMSAGCELQTSRSTGPSQVPDSGILSLIGTWTSAPGTTGGLMAHVLNHARTTDITSSSGCNSIQWIVSSQSGSSATGELRMECKSVFVLGTGTANVSGSSVAFTLGGTATMPSGGCTFNVSGTGALTSDTLTLPYSGTTCLGPISGNEVLQRNRPAPTPTPEPEPTPTPTPTPTPGPSGVASDHFDMSQATIRNSPLDLASWPITTALTTVDIRPSGIAVDFSKKDGPGRWPDVVPPGWDGGLQYTLGMCLNIGGRWYCSAVVQYWHGLPESGGEPWNYAMNWFYDPFRWAPMTGHQPAPGETIGFFVCAGDCRNNTRGDLSPVKERTNVVLVPMPGNGGATYRF